MMQQDTVHSTLLRRDHSRRIRLGILGAIIFVVGIATALLWTNTLFWVMDNAYPTPAYPSMPHLDGSRPLLSFAFLVGGPTMFVGAWVAFFGMTDPEAFSLRDSPKRARLFMRIATVMASLLIAATVVDELRIVIGFGAQRIFDYAFGLRLAVVVTAVLFGLVALSIRGTSESPQTEDGRATTPD